MRISSAELLRNYREVADAAKSEAVTITRDGEEELVLLSADEYARLKRRDRKVIPIEAFSDEEIRRIAETEMSGEHARLDEEITDWKP